MLANRLAVACVFACFFVSTAFAQSRPNIVLVISDDQRWDALGAAGNPNVKTPAMDRLAREGTYFRQGTIHVPQCSPSRATLLTGLSPHQHGWYSNQAAQSARADAKLFTSMPMLPALLRDAGYRTVYIGKWHLTPEPWDCGFTDVRTWLPGGGGPYQDAGLAHGNSRKHPVQKGFINQIFGDDAVAFIDSPAAKEKPFFLWLALTAPHMPTKPNPPDIEKLYAGKANPDLIPQGFPEDRADAGDWVHYYEACSMADRQLGNVLDALDRAKLDDNTMVIFLGDNGFMMGGRDVPQFKKNKPYLGKVFPYEDSIRVPMIIRAPGKNEGTSDVPASSLDLPPTILKSAGLTPPPNWPGRDLRGNLAAITESISEFADNESDKFGDIAYRTIRTPQHKLIVWEEQSRKPELYDVAADPHEAKNLFEEEASKGVRDDLLARLRQWMARTSDPALKWPHLSETKGS